MKRQGIELKQIPIAGFFMFSTAILMAGAILGFGTIGMGEFDLFLQIFIVFIMIAFVPLMIYIAFFTRFNNPFKKVEATP